MPSNTQFKSRRTLPTSGIKGGIFLFGVQLLALVLAVVALRVLVQFATGHDLFNLSQPINIVVLVAAILAVTIFLYKHLSSARRLRRLGRVYHQKLTPEQRALIRKRRQEFQQTKSELTTTALSVDEEEEEGQART